LCSAAFALASFARARENNGNSADLLFNAPQTSHFGPQSIHPMKQKIIGSFLLFLLICSCVAAPAEQPQFPGLKTVMPPETYTRAGLENLSPEQRAALDEFIRGYVSAKQKDAATVAAAAAVDKAMKEKKVVAPDVIDSRIVGDFVGTGPRVRYHLANGQTWKPTDDDVVPHSPIPNPAVVIYKDFFGYKMFVENAGVVRVKRVN